MSPIERLQKLASHFTTTAPQSEATSKIVPSDSHEYHHRNNYHTLSPTSFLWRAAQIEPHVSTSNGYPAFLFCCAILLYKISLSSSESRGLIPLLLGHSHLP